jgi:hypothetical protein
MFVTLTLLCWLFGNNQELKVDDVNHKSHSMPKFENDSLIIVSSTVDFYKYEHRGDSLDAVRFRVKIINHSKLPVPNLSVSNRSKHLNLLINGKIDNPMTFYNGMEIPNDTNITAPGDTSEFETSWVFERNSGIWGSYGEDFTAMAVHEPPIKSHESEPNEKGSC